MKCLSVALSLQVKHNLECNLRFSRLRLFTFSGLQQILFIRTEDSYYLLIFVLQLINTFISLNNIFTIITFVILL